jgi:Domain of unknown function (DUF4386)
MATVTTASRTPSTPASPPPQRRRLDPIRKTSLAAGVCYLITFVSIPTLALYGPVREAGYIAGAGPGTAAVIGGILEVIVALAGIGTAIALFPVVKRQNEALGMGFVGSRVLEAAAIVVGVGSLLTIVTLRQAGAGADATVTGDALVALYDRMFVLGQSLMPAVNALLLGTLMYQSRLVPRILPTLGLIGAPLQIIAVTGVLFDLWGRNSGMTALLVIPIVIWEFSLGVYLVVKGFRREAVDRLAHRRDPVWDGYEAADTVAVTG